MKSFLSAEGMKKHTDEIINTSIELELEGLQKLMYKAECYYIEVPKLSENAKRFLTDKGYKVKYYCDQRERESYYTISWK